MKRLLLVAASGLALSATFEARAQSQANAENVLARACAGHKDQEISRADVVEALLIEARISPSEFIGDIAAPSGVSLEMASGRALLERLRMVRETPFERLPEGVKLIIGSESLQLALDGAVLNIEQQLAAGSANVRVENSNSETIALLAERPPTWRMVCITGQRPSYTVIQPSPPPRFAIRATPEELWLTGDDARSAGALTLGFERTRSILEDGTRKTDTSFSIAGTLGYRISPRESTSGHAFLFATYDLQRDRTRPRPVLGPDERESDGDTNALAVGLDATLISWGRLPVDLNFQASTVFDFANDASRLRLRAIATPGIDRSIGLCRIGSFTGGPLRRRCEFAAEIEAAHVLRRGRTELGDFDNFLALGGRASFELFLPTSGDDTGFLGSVQYRFLPVIHGAPDDIERFEARLAHRFWTSESIGVDVGVTYTRGTNELSFEDEDVLTLGLGIVY